jgi:hypothetical protein
MGYNIEYQRETNMSKRSTVSPDKTAIQKLAGLAGKEVAVPTRSTVAIRKAQLLADLDGFDGPRLWQLKEELSSFVDLITMSIGDGAVLDESNAFTLMTQALSRRTITEFMEVCNGRIKEIVFSHLNAMFEEDGEDDPEAVSGSIEVPSLGMRFAREGAGRTTPSVDEGILREALGDRWKEVYHEETIPAQKVRTLDYDRLWELVGEEPELMEKLRDALEPGAIKNARLVIRPMDT